jgi:RNA polymerase sigma-70 factor (sigma-E family)
VRAADRESFTEFVTVKRASLVRSSYLLCGDHQLAEDLVQTALVKAVAVWRRIADNPEPWLRRVIVNDHISRWRRHRGREKLVDLVPERSVAAEPELALALEAALRTLAPRQRAVVVLRYYEDLTERETARLLGISVGTVKSQARDALQRLRERVPGLDVDEPVRAAAPPRPR